MGDWANFFIAEVGASAALAGLVFVGVSINLTRILSIPRLPGRALLLLLLLLTLLVSSSLQLVPGQPLSLLGTEVLIIGLLIWIVALRIDIDILLKTEPAYRRLFLLNVGLSQLATIPYIIAGLTLLISGRVGLYWLVPAIVFSFLKTVLDSWVLLVEINR